MSRGIVIQAVYSGERFVSFVVFGGCPHASHPTVRTAEECAARAIAEKPPAGPKTSAP